MVSFASNWADIRGFLYEVSCGSSNLKIILYSFEFYLCLTYLTFLAVLAIAWQITPRLGVVLPELL